MTVKIVVPTWGRRDAIGAGKCGMAVGRECEVVDAGGVCIVAKERVAMAVAERSCSVPTRHCTKGGARLRDRIRGFSTPWRSLLRPSHRAQSAYPYSRRGWHLVVWARPDESQGKDCRSSARSAEAGRQGGCCPRADVRVRALWRQRARVRRCARGRAFLLLRRASVVRAASRLT